ncbi:MAG TPA: energy transducer TonB [Cytophagaceae bacterium]
MKYPISIIFCFLVNFANAQVLDERSNVSMLDSNCVIIGADTCCYFTPVPEAFNLLPDSLRQQYVRTVMVEFVIEKNGTVTAVRLVEGLNNPCDQAVINAIYSTSGKWTPGMNNGQPVRLRKLLPVKVRYINKKI